MAPGISQSTSEGDRPSRTVTCLPAASSSWSSPTEMEPAVMTCSTAADEDIAKEWDRPRDPGHHPDHPMAGGAIGHCSRHHPDCVAKALVGDEPASGHHLEWTGSDLEVNQAAKAVAGEPIIYRLEEHARADLAEKGLASLRCGWLSPLEFSREDQAAGPAHTNQFTDVLVAVDEHRDGLGHHAIEVAIWVGQSADVCSLHGYSVADAGHLDVRDGPIQHVGRDVGSRDGHHVVFCHRDGCGPHATADVEHLLLRRQCRESEQFLGCLAASGMDDMFSQ